MNKTQKLISVCLIFVFSIAIFAGCSNSNNSSPTNSTTNCKNIVGVLVYQNTPNNTDWNNIDNFENYVTSQISFETKTKTSNKFLFYIFNNESETFESNTRFYSTKTSDTLKFDIELLYETTEVYTCFIYKDSSNNLKLSPAGFQNIDFSKANSLAHTVNNQTTSEMSTIKNIEINYSNNLSSIKK